MKLICDNSTSQVSPAESNSPSHPLELGGFQRLCEDVCQLVVGSYKFHVDFSGSYVLTDEIHF